MLHEKATTLRSNRRCSLVLIAFLKGNSVDEVACANQQALLGCGGTCGKINVERRSISKDLNEGGFRFLQDLADIRSVIRGISSLAGGIKAPRNLAAAASRKGIAFRAAVHAH
jgi:hypothetical protein